MRLPKNLRTSNSYFDEAISKSEEEIEETIKTKYEDISRQLDAGYDKTVLTLH